MKSNRKVIFGLMVAAVSLSTLFLCSGRGPALAVGRTIPSGTLRDTNTSFAAPLKESGRDTAFPAVGLQGVTLERSSPANPLLPASVSFNIGSCQYRESGVVHTMDVAPAMKDNRVYLPVIYMGYAMGMVDNDILWNPATRTAAFNFANHSLTFTLGSPVYTVDGAAHTMDAPPLVVSGHMAVPPEYFAGVFGYGVVWNLGVDPGQDPGSGDVFVVVDTKIPEQLYVCRGSSVVLATYCNTGVAQAPTPAGVFQVFAKLPSDTMRGKNPDGSKYFDANVPWVMYFDGGCAIHGFARAGYGFPQSVGCVELPVDVARKVYNLVPVGTKVYLR